MAQNIICHNLVGGSWLPGAFGEQDIFSPHNGNKLGSFSLPSKKQMDEAVALAAKAQKDWALRPIKDRSRVLYAFRQILLREMDSISALKSSECGKTFEEAKAGLMKGIEVTEFALSLQNLDHGGKMDVSRGVSCEFRREPLGVVASITPFNFPAMVPLWTIPIALVLGNSLVWKPSEKTPLTAQKIGDALIEAGLPAGVFTILHGGSDTVNAIIDHAEVKAISFVGSSKVAKYVFQRGTNLGKRVLALGGAKNPIILLPDANQELSGMGISDSFTGCAGQRCMAASLLLAVGDVDGHIRKIIERASSLRASETLGAIITKSQLEFLHGAIARAEKAGAKILLDGRKMKAPMGMENGNWIGPTVLDNVSADAEAATTELFGPILSIIRCRDISHALEIERSGVYGNACSVFTSSGPLSDRVIKEASAGMVGVNVGVPVPREPFSFGGVKSSKFGHGDITGEASLDFWSNLKKITVKWEKQNDSNWMS